RAPIAKWWTRAHTRWKGRDPGLRAVTGRIALDLNDFVPERVAILPDRLRRARGGVARPQPGALRAVTRRVRARGVLRHGRHEGGGLSPEIRLRAGVHG